MKKILFNAVCASALVFGAMTANARPTDDFQNPPHEMHMRRGPAPEHMLKEKNKHGGPERLAEELGLTDEQKEQAKKIHEQGREKVKPLMEKMKKLHEEMEKLRKENMDEFEKILTPEQKTKLEKIKAEKKHPKEKKNGFFGKERKKDAKQPKK